jgi:hypothetical protein
MAYIVATIRRSCVGFLFLSFQHAQVLVQFDESFVKHIKPASQASFIGFFLLHQHYANHHAIG